MLYCTACKQYIQQIGPIPYEIGDICPECRGSRLIDKPEEKTEGPNITGSGNVLDMHKTEQNIENKNDYSQNRDSHDDNSQHYDNRGQVNVQGDYQVTQYAAQKSDKEVDLLHQNKGRQQYSDACRRFFDNDGVIDLYEENELTKIQIEYDLDINWCQQEKERIKALSRDNCSLSKSAKYDLEDLIYAIKDHDVPKAATYANRLASLIKEKSHEELQYFYHLTLATLQPEKCTSEFEKSHSQNYWHTFWSYLAYLKQNKIDKAREVHNSLDAYRTYPEDNDMLIRTAGECILGDNSAKRDFSRIDEGYSPVLRDLYNSIAIIVRPDIAQREGLVEKEYLFYLKHIFNYETAEEREKKAREEQERREAEERRLKAEEERRRNEEEAKRQREAEEARLKAAEEARVKAELDAKRKAEEECRRKEEEARKKAEAEARAKPAILTFTVNGVSFDMVRVEGGTFTMGATPEMEDPHDDEVPTHKVTLSSYFMGETEVTQALWTALMDNYPSNNEGDNHPVKRVSWNDCQKFIKKLNHLTGKTFRMPTEAEWEFAARGGNKSNHTQYSGSSNINDVAWYKDNTDEETQPVATKQANELGIYDMSGNVWEWCSDWYGDYSKSAQTNPTGPKSGADRVLRGGCWNGSARVSRVSGRFRITPDFCYYESGLRLCLSEF